MCPEQVLHDLQGQRAAAAQPGLGGPYKREESILGTVGGFPQELAHACVAARSPSMTQRMSASPAPGVHFRSAYTHSAYFDAAR